MGSRWNKMPPFWADKIICINISISEHVVSLRILREERDRERGKDKQRARGIYIYRERETDESKRDRDKERDIRKH